MFNWIDVVIAVIVLYNVVRGFSLGFIRSVIGIIGYIVAFWISKEYHNAVASYLLTNVQQIAQLKTNLITSIEEMLLSSLAEGTSTLTNASLENSGIPFLESLSIGDFMNINATAVTTAHDVAVKISDFVISGIGAIVVFLTVLLLIKLIGVVLNAVMELPILKGVNRFAGLLIGLIKGCLFIFAVMTLLAFLSPAIHDTTIMQTLYASKIGNVFYNNNVLLALLNMFLLG